MAVRHFIPTFVQQKRPRSLASQGIREIVIPSAQVGPVTAAIRAMRSTEADVGFSDIAGPICHRDSFTYGIRALSRAEVEADEKLRAIRDEVAEIVARGREIRVQSFLAMRRARAAIRRADAVLEASRSTLSMGGHA